MLCIKYYAVKRSKKILTTHKSDLSRRGVRALAVFGSVARDEGTPSSDVDLLVDYDSKKGLFAFVGLKQYLEGILHCEVDLVTKNALHPALKKKFCKRPDMSSRTWIFRVEDIIKAIEKVQNYLENMTLSQFMRKDIFQSSKNNSSRS